MGRITLIGGGREWSDPRTCVASDLALRIFPVAPLDAVFVSIGLPLPPDIDLRLGYVFKYVSPIAL